MMVLKIVEKEKLLAISYEQLAKPTHKERLAVKSSLLTAHSLTL
jgi:hypothetical protein